jgi:hypothetical protein
MVYKTLKTLKGVWMSLILLNCAAQIFWDIELLDKFGAAEFLHYMGAHRAIHEASFFIPQG